MTSCPLAFATGGTAGLASFAHAWATVCSGSLSETKSSAAAKAKARRELLKTARQSLRGIEGCVRRSEAAGRPRGTVRERSGADQAWMSLRIRLLGWRKWKSGVGEMSL